MRSERRGKRTKSNKMREREREKEREGEVSACSDTADKRQEGELDRVVPRTEDQTHTQRVLCGYVDEGREGG